MMTRTNKIMRCRRAGSTVWRTAGCVLLLIAFIHGDLVRADEFQVSLQIQRGKHKAQATSKLPAREHTGANKTLNIKPRLKFGERNKTRPRPLFHVHVNQTAWVSWQVTQAGSSKTFKNLLVHVFAVKEVKAGQQQVSKLTNNAAYESALTMDFKPKDRAQGRFQLKFEQPGIYLVRAETFGLADTLGREFYVAADVEVDRAAQAKP